MKKFILAGVLIIGLSALAYITAQNNQAFGKCKPEQSQKAECCSRHGGVCGCNTQQHKLKCCDGTLSKSCGC